MKSHFVTAKKKYFLFIFKNDILERIQKDVTL